MSSTNPDAIIVTDENDEFIEIELNSDEPQLLFILRPLGLTPIAITFAPNDLSNSGPALYPAPFAQSITILKPLRLNSLVKFFFKIFK